ncbi:MAG: nucleotide exchange factor GrpE [Candidatus Omnitrophica bacterium]|nr:nucleotide exchange factor GrpE [Candidatus Omnitrophota bacterium]
MTKKNKKQTSKEEALEKIQKECDELRDRYLRLQAEFDNYRKRSLKERGDFVKFANEGLIVELLGILDNFERGIKAADLKKDFDLLHQGVDMISKQLHGLLESKGLKRIKALGEKFDPHQHEAMQVVETEGVEQDMVIEEMQPGYLLNGRIVRPAKVKVAKAKEEKKEDAEEDIIEDQTEEVIEEDFNKGG